MTLRLGRPRVRRRRDADDGDRQPHPGLVLRQGRDLGRGQGLRPGRAGRRRRAPRSSTSAASRPRPGVEIDAAEEKARVVDFVARVRAAFPGLVISVDTWRAEVGGAVCAAGADVLNDAWGGADPELVDVAAEHGAGDRLHAHRRRDAADPPLPDRVRRRGRRRDRRHRRLRRAGARRRRRPGVDRDRPGPRLRQEHLPLPRAHPAARRDGRHRLAGARVAVQQGLRRRDASTCRWASGSPAPSPRPRSARWPAPGSTACTRSSRPGRPSTWSAPSPAGGRRGARSGGCSERRRVVLVPGRARAAAGVRRPRGPGRRAARGLPRRRWRWLGRGGHGAGRRAGRPGRRRTCSDGDATAVGDDAVVPRGRQRLGQAHREGARPPRRAGRGVRRRAAARRCAPVDPAGRRRPRRASCWASVDAIVELAELVDDLGDGDRSTTTTTPFGVQYWVMRWERREGAASGRDDRRPRRALRRRRARPWLRVNMVSTVDGAATGDDGQERRASTTPPTSGSSTPCAGSRDAIVVGAGTARDEGYRPRPKPLVARQPPRRGARRGCATRRAGSVLMATCAAAEHLDEARGAAGRRPGAGARPAPRSTSPSSSAPWSTAGCTSLLCEGGPHLLRDLLAAGVVDELDLTVVPAPARRRAPPDHATARRSTYRSRCALLLEDDGTLLGRWLT